MRCWFLLVVFLSQIGISLANTLYIDADFIKSRFPTSLWAIEDPSFNAPPDSIAALFLNNSSAIIKEQKVNFGYKKAAFWFYTILHNSSASDVQIVVSLENPNIDSVIFYADYGYGFKKEAIAGDHVRHAHWQIATRQPASRLTIRAGESLPIMLKARNSFSGNMILPVQIWEYNHFASYQQAYHLSWGLYFGFLLINVALAFSAIVLLRANIFIWYGLFLIASLIYSFISFGFMYQFLTGAWPASNDVMRTYALLLISILMLRFSQVFLKSKEISPFTHNVITTIIWIEVLFLVSSFFILDTFRANFNQIFPWFLTLIFIGYALILTAAWFSKQKYRLRANAFLLAFTFSLIGGMTLILTDLNYLPYNNFTIHAPWFGNAIEIVIFTGIMFYEFKLVGDEKIKLEQQIAIEQTQRLREFFRGQEKERQRIARDLHDNVAGTLVGARFLMPNPAKMHKVLDAKSMLSYERALHTLDRSIKDVRNLSHNLQPPALDEHSLRYELDRLIADYQTMMPKTNYQLQYGLEEGTLSADTAVALYRICQECLLNIFKHADATQVLVQLVNQLNRIELLIEDNGRGFDEKKLKEGIGLQNIRSRLTFTQNLSTLIHSTPNQGTRIQLSFDRV